MSGTTFGFYHSHQVKGRDLLVTIAVPIEDGAAFVQALGPRPARFKKIALAMGAVGAALHDLLVAEATPAAVAAALPEAAGKTFDFGEAVKAIAHLTVRMALMTDAANGSTNTQAHLVALQARDQAAQDLTAAADEFNEQLRAAVAGGRHGQ